MRPAYDLFLLVFRVRSVHSVGNTNVDISDESYYGIENVDFGKSVTFSILRINAVFLVEPCCLRLALQKFESSRARPSTRS